MRPAPEGSPERNTADGATVLGARLDRGKRDEREGKVENMETVKFTCHGNSAPAYSCNKPGDMSGEYVKVFSDLDRRDVLLKAAYELLKKQVKSGYVLNLLAETVFYDETDCDGYCLANDIAYLLDLEDLDGM